MKRQEFIDSKIIDQARGAGAFFTGSAPAGAAGPGRGGAATPSPWLFLGSRPRGGGGGGATPPPSWLFPGRAAAAAFLPSPPGSRPPRRRRDPPPRGRSRTKTRTRRSSSRPSTTRSRRATTATTSPQSSTTARTTTSGPSRRPRPSATTTTVTPWTSRRASRNDWRPPARAGRRRTQFSFNISKHWQQTRALPTGNRLTHESHASDSDARTSRFS